MNIQSKLNGPFSILKSLAESAASFPTLLVAGLLLIAPAALATDRYWDVNGTTVGFSTVVGTWNNANNFWNTDVTGGAGGSLANTTTSADDLTIKQATVNTGAITISGTQPASSITFAANAGPTVTLSGGTAITIGGTGASSGIFEQSTGANTISTALMLNSANAAFNFANSSSGLLTIGAVTGSAAGLQTITVGSSSSGGITLNGIIGNGAGGGTVALAVNNSGAGLTTLSGANTFTGGLTIKSGTVAGTVANAFGGSGTGTIILGDSAGALDATLRGTLAGTFANRISVASGNSGTATITDTAASIFSGAVTLNSHNLTIGGNAGNALTMSGPITGTGNLTLNSTGAGVITLSSNGQGVNNTGTITHSGAGTAIDVISGVIGANVTGITQSSAGTLNLTFNGNQFAGSTVASAGKVKLGAQYALWMSPYDTTGATGPIGLDATGVTAPVLGGLAGNVALGTAVTAYNLVTALTLNPRPALRCPTAGALPTALLA